MRQRRSDRSRRRHRINGNCGLRGALLMEETRQETAGATGPASRIPTSLAPVLMMAFWILLGGAAGIKFTQIIWRLLGWGAGEVSIAVPVGGAGGAFVGALLGLIRNPRLLVLMMAVFAGGTAGAAAGK